MMYITNIVDVWHCLRGSLWILWCQCNLGVAVARLEVWCKRNPTIHGTTSRSKRGSLRCHQIEFDDCPNSENHKFSWEFPWISNCHVWLPKAPRISVCNRAFVTLVWIFVEKFPEAVQAEKWRYSIYQGRASKCSPLTKPFTHSVSRIWRRIPFNFDLHEASVHENPRQTAQDISERWSGKESRCVVSTSGSGDFWVTLATKTGFSMI